MKAEIVSTKHTLKSDFNRIGNFLRDLTPVQKLGLVGLAATGILANTLSASQNHDYSTVDTTGFDTDVTAIKIEGGARVRSEPSVSSDKSGPSNVLYETNEDVSSILKLPSGAEFLTNENGGWYGVTIPDIQRQDPELAEKIGDSDGDGIVWINHQRAKVTENKAEPYFEEFE
jgi:hypothetical protein